MHSKVTLKMYGSGEMRGPTREPRLAVNDLHVLQMHNRHGVASSRVVRSRASPPLRWYVRSAKRRCRQPRQWIRLYVSTTHQRNRNAAGLLVPTGSAARPGTASGVRAPPSSGRKIGENKLLSKAARVSPMSAKCLLCKQRASQERGKYCQGMSPG